MTQPVLEVKNIGKSYKSYRNELWRILSWFGIHNKATNETWTLKSITFHLYPGEAVGIIGQNGAGKSTLLKIITETLKPSTGSVVVHGKIAGILELGMGFHPELTGRQNAYHSAGLMGYTREQIDGVISEIESFAEVGEYFDQPVRLYSSGMQVRIAFAVATAYRPEILIIDEALSVGDAYFQHKSFDRIRQFRNAGTSLLFVSHDKGSILALCNRAILLEKGNMLKEGGPEEITNYYNALIAEKESSTIRQEKKEDAKVFTISGTGEASIEEIGLHNSNGEKVEVIGVGDRIELQISVLAKASIDDLVLGYMIKDRLGQPVFGTNTFHYESSAKNVKSNQKIKYYFSFDANFGVGSYSITTALHTNETHLEKNYEWMDQALVFNVINISKKTFTGICWLEPKVRVEYVG